MSTWFKRVGIIWVCSFMITAFIILETASAPFTAVVLSTMLFTPILLMSLLLTAAITWGLHHGHERGAVRFKFWKRRQT